MKQPKLENLITRTIENVEEDRAVASKLLTDLLIYMGKTGDAAHAASGHIAAQYLETLQRSNEQLVKVASIIQRQEGGTKGLSDSDKQNLFDSIKG